MTFTFKRKAYDALGTENFFSASSSATFLEQSTYGKRKQWLAEIQSGKGKYYATSLENDVSHYRRNNFRLLSKIQVEEMIPAIVNNKIRRYATLLFWLHDEELCIAKRDSMLNVANRLEDEIINDENTLADSDDIRRFLTVGILYGDKNHLYTMETIENFDRVCQAVK